MFQEQEHRCLLLFLFFSTSFSIRASHVASLCLLATTTRAAIHPSGRKIPSSQTFSPKVSSTRLLVARVSLYLERFKRTWPIVAWRLRACVTDSKGLFKYNLASTIEVPGKQVFARRFFVDFQCVRESSRTLFQPNGRFCQNDDEWKVGIHSPEHFKQFSVSIDFF